jgi:predicted acyl esterase
MEKTTMPIHVNEQISSKWFNTSHYPVVPACTKYFLDSSGALSPSQPAAAGEETLAWSQPSAGSRAPYESPKFTEGGTLAGPITASLFASSTTSNIELIGTLQEIALDGTVTTVSSGTVLGSMSENDPTRSWVDKNGVPVRPYGKYDADRYVPAGTIQQYDFLIYSRFASIRPGSKLRLVLTTQAPTDICSPFLGTDPCLPTAPQTASLTGSQITIHHGPSHPSAVNLPLLKANCWKSSDKVSGPFWKTDLVVSGANAPYQN